MPLILLALGCAGEPEDTGRAIEGVELTWLGVAGWLVRTSERAILLDAFFSRLDQDPGEGVELLRRVLDAEGLDGVDWLLVGHSHFDHAVDAGAAALEASAQLYGSETSCLIAASQGLPDDRCEALVHGDVRGSGDVELEIVRTIHWSPDSVSGAYEAWSEQPAADAAWGAPNGGVLSAILTVQTGEGDPLRIFYQGTLGPLGGDDGSGEDYPALLDDAFSPSAPATDVWLGPPQFADSAADLAAWTAAIRPRWVVPHHWDGNAPDRDAPLAWDLDAPDFMAATLAEAGATALVPTQYFERLRLTPGGDLIAADSPVRDAFGF